MRSATPHLLLLSTLIALIGAKFMKNYNVVIESIGTCPDNDKMESPFRKFRYGFYNRTHKTLNFEYTLKRPLDSKVGITTIVERRTEVNKWVAIPFLSFQPDLCNLYLRYFPEMWIGASRKMGVKKPDECPIPSGTYRMKDLVVYTGGVNIPFFSGTFRFTVTATTVRERIKVYCIITILTLEEIF